MNNNDINKIIEDIKDKIEECITYLNQENYSETVQKLKEINDIYVENLNTISSRDITNKLQEKYPKKMEEFDKQVEIAINFMSVKNLVGFCECYEGLSALNKENTIIQYLKKII